MNKKSTGLLLSVLGVVSLVLITAGVTYAFFSYAKEGETENTISTGTITFVYDEFDGTGNAIQITDALPMTDDEGKALIAANEIFNFRVTSTVSGSANIPYTVTARKDSSSTLSEDQMKLYLVANGSETNGTNHTVNADGSVRLYSELEQTGVPVPNGTIEKIIYNGTVPANGNYTEDFTLRMWMNGTEGSSTIADYSPYEFVLKTAATGTNALDADALITAGSFITSTAYYALTAEVQANYERVAYVNQTTRQIYTVSQTASVTDAPAGFEVNEQFYQINGQSFKIKVNVYANATVVNG